MSLCVRVCVSVCLSLSVVCVPPCVSLFPSVCVCVCVSLFFAQFRLLFVCCLLALRRDKVTNTSVTLNAAGQLKQKVLARRFLALARGCGKLLNCAQRSFQCFFTHVAVVVHFFSLFFSLSSEGKQLSCFGKCAMGYFKHMQLFSGIDTISFLIWKCTPILVLVRFSRKTRMPAPNSTPTTTQAATHTNSHKAARHDQHSFHLTNQLCDAAAGSKGFTPFHTRQHQPPTTTIQAHGERGKPTRPSISISIQHQRALTRPC